MSKFKSEYQEGGEWQSFPPEIEEAEVMDKPSVIHMNFHVWLTDGYRSLNHFVLNLSGATGAEFNTEGSALWLLPCGSPEMLFESLGP